MNKPVALFRSYDRDSERELEVCSTYLDTYRLRSKIPPKSLVIGRYSVLPYYNELEQDLQASGSSLLNSYRQHRYIANFDYYEDLDGITPRTWFDVTEASKVFNDLPYGMILKGRTNSTKQWEWMYAKTKDDFYRIDKYLHQHELTAQQGIVYREYVPLEVIEKSIIPNSFDFVNEWRFFCYKSKILVFDYYWSCASDEAIAKARDQILIAPVDLVRKCASIVSKRTNFFVVDVAKTADGRWIVVELNDGQMSGLSMCDENLLYNNLKMEIERDV